MTLTGSNLVFVLRSGAKLRLPPAIQCHALSVRNVSRFHELARILVGGFAPRLKVSDDNGALTGAQSQGAAGTTLPHSPLLRGVFGPKRN